MPLDFNAQGIQKFLKRQSFLFLQVTVQPFLLLNGWQLRKDLLLQGGGQTSCVEPSFEMLCQAVAVIRSD